MDLWGAGARTRAKVQVAEADGNRTRQGRDAPLNGFEDRGAHQDPDASAGRLPAGGRVRQAAPRRLDSLGGCRVQRQATVLSVLVAELARHIDRWLLPDSRGLWRWLQPRRKAESA